MPLFAAAQLAAAVRAGPLRRATEFDDDGAWRTFQEEWLHMFMPEQQLPHCCDPGRCDRRSHATLARAAFARPSTGFAAARTSQPARASPSRPPPARSRHHAHRRPALARRDMWKMATRRHKKIVAQLEKRFGGRTTSYGDCPGDKWVAWKGGDEAAKQDMLRYIDAPVPNPYRLTFSKDDCVAHPPPNLHDFAADARGPGSAPAAWFKRWYSMEYDDSDEHQAAYDHARTRWRKSDACLAQSLASWAFSDLRPTPESRVWQWCRI